MRACRSPSSWTVPGGGGLVFVLARSQSCLPISRTLQQNSETCLQFFSYLTAAYVLYHAQKILPVDISYSFVSLTG